MNERLENEKISKLLLSMAIPAILAQLATLIYNMVDRIYIGQLPDGSLGIAGIGLCTSIITIITAFTNLFGRGGAHWQASIWVKSGQIWQNGSWGIVSSTW